MTELKLIAIDTSKHIFTLHKVNKQGDPVLRRELRRAQLEPFFRKQAPTDIVLEAGGGSHHWGRMLTGLGHQVRLIPAQYVKPFVKRGKNDRIDAAAICAAALRPSMHVVPKKPLEAQAAAMVLTVRETLVKQRTQLINTIRGHAGEYGVIAAKGTTHITALLERIAADPAIPAAAQAMFVVLGRQLDSVSEEIAAHDRRLAAAWLRGLLQRRPKMLVAVALANMMARVVWAMMTRGEAYRPTAAAA